MSPREKGRYLREHGWKSTGPIAYQGTVSWRDPLNPSSGSVTTSVAYAEQKARDIDALLCPEEATQLKRFMGLGPKGKKS